jgi:hypothetical protein
VVSETPGGNLTVFADTPEAAKNTPDKKTALINFEIFMHHIRSNEEHGL